MLLIIDELVLLTYLLIIKMTFNKFTFNVTLNVCKNTFNIFLIVLYK